MERPTFCTLDKPFESIGQIGAVNKPFNISESYIYADILQTVTFANKRINAIINPIAPK